MAVSVFCERFECFYAQQILWLGNFCRLCVSLPNNTPIDWVGLAYLIQTSSDHARYYTLRTAWCEAGQVFGWIDIHTHGDTLGSLWAKSLTPDTAIIAKCRYFEQTHHLGKAPIVLADETSLPAALALSERHKNATLVACIREDCDLVYLKDCCQNAIVVRYQNPKELTKKLNQTLGLVCKESDSFWGALEAGVVKSLRPQIADFYQDKRYALKPYWRA